MCREALGFVLLVVFPGALHAQSAAESCRAPGLNHGYFLHELKTYPHETTLTYSCDTGFKPAEEGWWATSTCHSGKWSHEPQCIDENACIPPTIPKATYTENSHGWFEEGSEINIICDKGYESINLDTTARCVRGSWSSLPVCERSVSSCSEPPRIPNAVVINQSYQEVFAAGSVVQYECKDGYTTWGGNPRTSISCTSGDWSEASKCTTDCFVNTADRPELKSNGIQHIQDGTKLRLECVKRPEWWMKHYSEVHCISGVSSFSPCCNTVEFNLNDC